ncbi:MAG: hypothetical protein ABR881_20690 [Candidatus Sulfotelmatobacter sp.]|jgi:hypothetical protein
MYSFPLSVASATETVEVTASAPQIQTDMAEAEVYGAVAGRIMGDNVSQLTMTRPGLANRNTASANVLNLQRRVAGVLPVSIDVPRTGTSFSFVRPLVLDEETKVTFSYKSR